MATCTVLFFLSFLGLQQKKMAATGADSAVLCAPVGVCLSLSRLSFPSRPDGCDWTLALHRPLVWSVTKRWFIADCGVKRSQTLTANFFVFGRRSPPLPLQQLLVVVVRKRQHGPAPMLSVRLCVQVCYKQQLLLCFWGFLYGFNGGTSGCSCSRERYVTEKHLVVGFAQKLTLDQSLLDGCE